MSDAKRNKREYDKIYRPKNAERIRQYQRQYREEHKEVIVKYRREWYAENRKAFLAACKAKYDGLSQEDKRAKQELNKRWVATHPELSRRYSRDYYHRSKGMSVPWSKRNPERRREIARNWIRQHRKTPKGSLDSRMSRSVRKALKDAKAGRSWEQLVGYDLNILHAHIENHFKAGMNWKRFLNGEIHIDHIIPKVAFNYTSPDEQSFRQCWALENLDPKWKTDNLTKNARLLKPEQIALGI